MRRSATLALLALGSCAYLGPAPRPVAPVAEVRADGRVVRVAGESWVAEDGITFFVRGDELHVVSLAPGHPFDVAVPLREGAPIAWPKGAPFEAHAHAVRLVPPSGPATFAELVRTGQLQRHDDHFHLTHRLVNEDWQALYRHRADDGPLPAVRRRTAGILLAQLVELPIPGDGGRASEEGVARALETVGRVRRGFEAGLTAAQLEGVARHGYEITDDGRRLDVDGKTFRAAPGVRFAYCSGHFHVEDAGDRWAQIVEPAPGPFAFPSSALFDVGADGVVVPEAAPSRAREQLESGQLRYTHGHVHLTDRYEHPSLQRLLSASADPKLASEKREAARAAVLDVLRLKFELGTGEDVDAKLAEAHALLEARAKALDAKPGTPKR